MALAHPTAQQVPNLIIGPFISEEMVQNNQQTGILCCFCLFRHPQTKGTQKGTERPKHD
jgi:hypothetical protein